MVGVLAYSVGSWPSWQLPQSILACTAKSGSRLRLWTRKISSWFDHVLGAWQDSQRTPSSPLWGSLWQSRQEVPTWVNTRLRWQVTQLAWAWAPSRGKPDFSWRNVNLLASGTQRSELWQSLHSRLRLP